MWCRRAVPHSILSSSAGSGCLQEAWKNNVAGLCSFPFVSFPDFFLTSELLPMCLIALNAFPCALFSFFSI